jgi:rhodanese-related sulfurtransferase
MPPVVVPADGPRSPASSSKDSTMDATTTDGTDPACAVPLPVDLDALAVDPTDAAAAIAAGALFVDVRHPDTRARQGETPGAEVVDKTAVEERFGGGAEPSDRAIVVICGSEGGSGPVVAQLRGMGYTAVTHVRGGHPAWTAYTG